MRHVLFIHYFFLPVHNVAVRRLLGYTRHLHRFNWRATVITHDWRGIDEVDASWGLSWEPHLEADSGCAIHRVASVAAREPHTRAGSGGASPRASAGVVDRLTAKASRLRQFALGPYPDPFVHWADPAVEAAVTLSRRDAVDAVVTYCPPVTNHVVGHRLAGRLGVPWAPFFGDLYGFLEPPLPRWSLEGWLKRRWHDRCLAPAAACAAVSPAMAAYLSRRYGKPVELVHTGFDEPSHEAIEDRPARGRFVVSHVGSVYPDDQRPEILLDGLDRLLDQHPEIADRIEVRFVGSKCDQRLREMLVGRRAEAACRVMPHVDSATASALVRDSDVLLALTCSQYRDRFGTLSYPTKIFEAFGARRPILAVPADGDWVDELLARTGGGASARDAQDVADRLWGWYLRWARQGGVGYDGIDQELAPLSRTRQTQALCRLLDSVVETHHARR